MGEIEKLDGVAKWFNMEMELIEALCIIVRFWFREGERSWIYDKALNDTMAKEGITK